MSTKEKVKKQLDEMDDQIGVWEAKTENAKVEPKAQCKEKLADLKAKRNEIKAKYDEPADATEENWGKSKSVFSSDYESFRERLKSLNFWLFRQKWPIFAGYANVSCK